MHVPTANQQLGTTRMLAGQFFSLSTAQIAPSCWSLLWWIKWAYVEYTLSISFCKYCSLEVMFLPWIQTVTKLQNWFPYDKWEKDQHLMWLVMQRTNKNYSGTVLLPLFVNSLKPKFTWTASNITHKTQNKVGTRENDHPHEFGDCHSGVVMEFILLRCDAVSAG